MVPQRGERQTAPRRGDPARCRLTDADTRVRSRMVDASSSKPFLLSDVVRDPAVPNVVPRDDSVRRASASRARPGDRRTSADERTAEHVPGCNMACRRDALRRARASTRFYMRAGTTMIDVCWRTAIGDEP